MKDGGKEGRVPKKLIAEVVVAGRFVTYFQPPLPQQAVLTEVMVS